jgi:alpha-tubulin suppressor-like RCC1 family protein
MRTYLVIPSIFFALISIISGCSNSNSSNADQNNSSSVLAAGRSHIVTLTSDGTVWSTGNNYYGQLGNGTTTDSNTLVQANGLSGVIAVAGGYDFSAALKNDGTVWAWGYNYYGQLGDGTSTDRNISVQVKVKKDDKLDIFSGVIAIAAGDGFTVALKDDGTVWSWGVNRWYGQLGNGTMTDSNTPVQVVGLSGVTAIAAGSCNAVALKNDGTVWAWGDNANGELGAGHDINNLQIFPNSNVPVQVCATTDNITGVCLTYLTGVKAIAVGDRSTFALKNNGTVWSWGANWNGQLGDGTTTDRYIPVQVTGLTDITAISAGFRHNIALKNDGTVWSWGVNWYGQLGDGTVGDSSIPVQVMYNNGSMLEPFSGVIGIAAGDGFSAALRNDGTIWAWGTNSSGQLGNGTTTDRLTPVQMSGHSVL